MSGAFLAGWRADNQPLALPGASSASIPATGGTAYLWRKLGSSTAIWRGRFFSKSLDLRGIWEFAPEILF